MASVTGGLRGTYLTLGFGDAGAAGAGGVVGAGDGAAGAGGAGVGVGAAGAGGGVGGADDVTTLEIAATIASRLTPCLSKNLVISAVVG
jgi:hypothetical protein